MQESIQLGQANVIIAVFHHLPPMVYFTKSHNNNLMGKHEVLKMGAALMGLVEIFSWFNFQAHPCIKSLLGSPLARQVLWAS